MVCRCCDDGGYDGKRISYCLQNYAICLLTPNVSSLLFGLIRVLSPKSGNFAANMKTEYNGPEMSVRKVAVLLATAVLLVVLFSLRTCSCSRNRFSRFEPNHYQESWIEISDFDELMRQYQDSTFDWLLLSAIANVESKFDTTVQSAVGAFGLMQMMPSTYKQMLREMDIDTNQVSTELNVKAAVRYLHVLDDQYSFISMPERLNYILGSYNGGTGHVFDAMRLARRDGINRYKWDCIVPVLQSLGSDSVYSDTLCRNGQFLAVETISYVQKVQCRYNQYRKQDLMYQATRRLCEHLKTGDASEVEITPLVVFD